MQKFQAEAEAAGAVWLRINSGAPGKEGADPAMNSEKASAWGINGTILVDSDGSVGRNYGAAHTPEIIVIGTDGKIAYRGAADSGGQSRKPGTGAAYVTDAVKAALAGETPAVIETKAVGCSVKYAD
jgi:hypothetical protein